jgi:hypothetical protein
MFSTISFSFLLHYPNTSLVEYYFFYSSVCDQVVDIDGDFKGVQEHQSWLNFE